MPKTNTEQKSSKQPKGRGIAAEIANTFEWLAIAFILAFVFRTFIMEAFRIPTGSMAVTLSGAHFRLRCSQCGYRYNRGFDTSNAEQRPIGNLSRVPQTRCPNCGYYEASRKIASISHGDRILVLKCIYQFFEPNRWDVVVFKNPLEPQINYIKRLIGRPGETIEIIDGDIYVDGTIARKPPKAQKELWLTVYDNDYQPARPKEKFFNGHRWRQPFRNTPGSAWEIDPENPTRSTLTAGDSKTHTLYYDTTIGNDFRADYAYNDPAQYIFRPYCSDLMIRFYVSCKGQKGIIGASLSKYETEYKGRVDFSGLMSISEISDGKEQILIRRTLAQLPDNRMKLFKFINVDHKLTLQFGTEELIYDLGVRPQDAGPRNSNTEPQVRLFGSGGLTVSHIAIYRDIHYISRHMPGTARGGRASEGRAITLDTDEFFVLGDNSPNSLDGRWWSREGIGNNGHFYRKGIVPREYLVGKALFVYWPGGYEFPWPSSLKNAMLIGSRNNRLMQALYTLATLKWIPDVSQMRLIYGGSSKHQP